MRSRSALPRSQRRCLTCRLAFLPGERSSQLHDQMMGVLAHVVAVDDAWPNGPVGDRITGVTVAEGPGRLPGRCHKRRLTPWTDASIGDPCRDCTIDGGQLGMMSESFMFRRRRVRQLLKERFVSRREGGFAATPCKPGWLVDVQPRDLEVTANCARLGSDHIRDLVERRPPWNPQNIYTVSCTQEGSNMEDQRISDISRRSVGEEAESLANRVAALPSDRVTHPGERLIPTDSGNAAKSEDQRSILATHPEVLGSVVVDWAASWDTHAVVGTHPGTMIG